MIKLMNERLKLELRFLGEFARVSSSCDFRRVLEFDSGAPAGAESARGRSIHSYIIWLIHQAEKIWL